MKGGEKKDILQYGLKFLKMRFLKEEKDEKRFYPN